MAKLPERRKRRFERSTTWKIVGLFARFGSPIRETTHKIIAVQLQDYAVGAYRRLQKGGGDIFNVIVSKGPSLRRDRGPGEGILKN